MSASFDPGPIRDAILALLQAKLPAKFTALDTEYDDGIGLQVPGNVNYFKALLDQYPDYPSIVMYPTLNEPENQMGGFQNRRHIYTIHFLAVSNEALESLLPVEVLEVRLERSLRGIEEVLDENRTLTVANLNHGVIETIGPTEYQDFEYFEPADMFGRSAIIPLEVICQ